MRYINKYFSDHILVFIVGRGISDLYLLCVFGDTFICQYKYMIYLIEKGVVVYK